MKGLKVLSAIFILVLAATAYQYYSAQSETKKLSEQSTLIPFQKDQINELSLSGIASFKVVKTADGWRLQEPLQDEADSEHMDNFLSTVLGEKATQIVKEGSEIDWSLFGLNQGFSTYIFKNQGGQETRVDISAVKNFEGNPYLRVNQKNQLLVGNITWTNFAAKTALDFRNKNLFRQKKTGIQKIEILRNGQVTTQLVLEKGMWQLPRHPKWKLDQNLARQLLTEVSTFKAIDFLPAETPMAKSSGLELQLSLADQVIKLKFSQDAHKQTYAWISNPVLMAKVDSGFYEKLRESQDQTYRDHKEPFQFDLEQVQKIHIQTALKKFDVVKKDQAWQLQKSTDEEVSAGAADELLKNLKNLEAESFLESPTGFSATHQIDLFSAEGTLIFSFAWSEQKKSDKKSVGHYLGRTSKTPELIYVDAASVDLLSLLNLVIHKN